MTIIIGIDPHKATHTAVAIDENEQPLAEFQLTADRCQAMRLLAWAAPFDDRAWAVESADGLGKLLSQQLVAEGEHVIDVPATLAAKVRLLGSTKASKNDPNDALSTAIAGLRYCGLRQVVADDHRQAIRMLVRRFGDLTARRTQAVCRLHAVLIELIPGGLPRKLKADQAPPRCGGCAPTTRSVSPASSSPPTWSSTCAAATANSSCCAIGSPMPSTPPARRCSRSTAWAPSWPH